MSDIPYYGSLVLLTLAALALSVILLHTEAPRCLCACVH